MKNRKMPNRRISMTKSGTAFASAESISYNYNDRSEVTAAQSNANSEYNYMYDFDNIGNRKTASERGITKSYQSNALNQYEGNDFAFDMDGSQIQER